MLEIPIRKRVPARWLAMALLGAAAALSSCASQKPAPALVSDPDAHAESSVPWNRPENWEGRGNLPPGANGDAFGGDRPGGTGGY